MAAVPPVLARWVVRSDPSHPIYILPTLLFFCLLQIIYSDGMSSARRLGPPGTLREVVGGQLSSSGADPVSSEALWESAICPWQLLLSLRWCPSSPKPSPETFNSRGFWDVVGFISSSALRWCRICLLCQSPD